MLYRTKSVVCLIAAIIFVGALALIAAPAGAFQDVRGDSSSWVVGEIPGSPVGYCHMKFPAIDEKTLGTEEPKLERPDSGNIIDFYGPCGHNPLGAEEVQRQMNENQQERTRDGE